MLNPHLVASLRMSGALPALLYTPSWRAQWNLYLIFILHNFRPKKDFDLEYIEVRHGQIFSVSPQTGQLNLLYDPLQMPLHLHSVPNTKSSLHNTIPSPPQCRQLSNTNLPVLRVGVCLSPKAALRPANSHACVSRRYLENEIKFCRFFPQHSRVSETRQTTS